MSEWYNKVTADPKDLIPLVACIDYFEKELITARKEIKIKGSLEKASARLPGIVEHRFRQYEEVESILRYLNIRLGKKRHAKFKMYLEGYSRALTAREAEKYAEHDDEVYEFALLINRFALLRNQFQGIFKALEVKGYQINNIVKLRVAGMDDADIKY